jgi:hypothetical protein
LRSRAHECRHRNTERRQAEENDKKGESRESDTADSERGNYHCLQVVSVRRQHPGARRDEQARRGGGNPAEYVPNDNKMSVTKKVRPSEKPIVQGVNRKPDAAAIAPINPHNFAPAQTAMPTTFGPGMNRQRLRMSANSSSVSHLPCSTVMRRIQMGPP